MFQPFWMVLGEGTPVVRHGTLAVAEQEAERLARLCPTKEFVVLMAVARCKKTDVTWERVDGREFPIPF